MTKALEEMTEAELASYYHEHRDDPNLWGDPIPSPLPAGSSIRNVSYKITFTREQFSHLSETASAAGISIGELIHRALAAYEAAAK